MTQTTTTANPLAVTTPREIRASVTPLRVALMLESDGPGGSEVMILRLAEGLRRRGHHAIHVGPGDGCGWLGERFREAGFDSEAFSLRRPHLQCVQGLVRMLRQRRVDIVHSHEFMFSVYGAAAARWIGKPHFLTHHSSLYFTRKWRRRVALRWACRSSALAVAVSKVTRLELEKELDLKPGSVRVIHNGVDYQPSIREPIRQELGVRPDEVLIVAVGTVEPRKGHILLLQALAEIRRRRPHLLWRVAIAGQDRFNTTRDLRAFATEHGLDDRVHLLGHRKDTWRILAAADLFAMPSLHEGLPMALLEAMRAGLPVVASRAGGIPEAFTPEEEGSLVPVGDVPALAAALEPLLADPELRRTMGERCRRRAEAAFTVETMTAAYERLYLAAHGARRP